MFDGCSWNEKGRKSSRLKKFLIPLSFLHCSQLHILLSQNLQKPPGEVQASALTWPGRQPSQPRAAPGIKGKVPLCIYPDSPGVWNGRLLYTSSILLYRRNSNRETILPWRSNQCHPCTRFCNQTDQASILLLCHLPAMCL